MRIVTVVSLEGLYAISVFIYLLLIKFMSYVNYFGVHNLLLYESHFENLLICITIIAFITCLYLALLLIRFSSFEPLRLGYFFPYDLLVL